MLLLKHLKLIREGSLDCSLHGLDGFTRDTNHVVIKNLPLLGSSFVEHNLLIMNLFSSDNIFNPVFHLNEDLLHAGITLHTSSSTLSPVELDHVVSGVKVIMVARPRFNIELSGSLTAFELVSQLLQTSLAVNSS